VTIAQHLPGMMLDQELLFFVVSGRDHRACVHKQMESRDHHMQVREDTP
jgi:hypothetical protein